MKIKSTNKEIVGNAIKRIKKAQATVGREEKTHLNIALLYLNVFHEQLCRNENCLHINQFCHYIKLMYGERS